MKTRRFFGLFLFLLVSLFAFGLNASVKAEYGTSADIKVEGAQVRTTGNAGLRFVATENVQADTKTAFGIVLAFGEASADENFVKGGTVNGKAVTYAEVDSTNEGQFAVTLYDIPESMYNQKVSARAYVVADGEYVYSKEVCVRSLADVVIAAYKAGDESEFVKEVYEIVQSSIDLSEYKKIFKDDAGRLFVASAKYESDYKAIAEKFIADWNEMFKTELNVVDAFIGGTTAPFYKSAKTNSQKDWTGSKLVSFFQNEDMSAKWSWILELVSENSTNDFTKKQIAAIKTNVADEENWWYSAHLCSALMSLLSGSIQSAGFAGGLNTTTNPAILLAISLKNNTIPTDVKNSELVKIGEKINLPDAMEKNYYDWSGYKADKLYAANEEITLTSENCVFVPTFTPTQYTVKFFDGNEEITTLAFTYDIEDKEIVLKAPAEKDGYVFEGWFSNPEFTGSVITTIAAGSHGDKVIYAKITKISGYTITYNFNGGNTKYANYDAVVKELLSDLSTYYGKEITVETLWDYTYKASGTMAYDFFNTNETFSTKWNWLGQYLLSVRASQKADSYLADKTDSYWRAEIFGFVTKGARTSWPASSDYSQASTQIQYLTFLSNVEEKEYINNVGETTLLTTVYKEGYTFAGWYTDAEFTGERVYSVTEATTLYAKWTKAE